MIGLICRRCSIINRSLPQGRNVLFCPNSCSWPPSRYFSWTHPQRFKEFKACSKQIMRRKSDIFANYIRYSSATVNANPDNIDDLYQLGYIYVKTSTERWIEIPEGVMFDAGFVDSMPEAPSDSKVPVILGLPSSLGSYKDLTKVLSVFVKSGYRVIIPNMPGSKGCMCRSRSEAIVFMHTPDEKAEFLTDFLSEIDVKKVHMVVTDSDSVYTAVYLCNQNNNMVQSLAMINPTGLKHTRYMKPVLMFRNINLMWEEVFFMQPVVWLLIAVLKVLTRKRHLSVSEIVTLSKTIRNTNFDEIQEELSNFAGLNKPCLALYTEDSETLIRESTEELLALMGIHQHNITCYSDNDEMITQGSREGNKSAVLFRGKVGNIKETKAKLIRTKLHMFHKSLKATVQPQRTQPLKMRL